MKVCSTGNDLRATRQQLGMSRLQLAQRAQVHPDTVRYWENKGAVDMRGYAVVRMLTTLGNGSESKAVSESELGISGTITRARSGLLDRLFSAPPVKTTSSKPVCGARTRKGAPAGRSRFLASAGASSTVD